MMPPNVLIGPGLVSSHMDTMRSQTDSLSRVWTHAVSATEIMAISRVFVYKTRPVKSRHTLSFHQSSHCAFAHVASYKSQLKHWY